MIATILAQTENRPKTTNGPHVVSYFRQKKFITTRFPEKKNDLSKMSHLLSSFKPMFFKTKSKKINICQGFAAYFRLNFRSYITP